jgi:hypothetical protein
VKLQTYQDDVYSIFRQCLPLVYQTFSGCSFDADCDAGIPCDLETHFCAPSSSIQETNYFNCIFDGFSSGIISSLMPLLSLPSDATNSEVYTALRQFAVTQDCVANSGLNIPFRSYNLFGWNGELGCTTEGYFGQGLQVCPDQTCDPGVSTSEVDCGFRLWVSSVTWLLKITTLNFLYIFVRKFSQAARNHAILSIIPIMEDVQLT